MPALGPGNPKPPKGNGKPVPTYRNTRTGRVASVSETPTTRVDWRGRDNQWRRYLNSMDASRRWERIPDEAPVAVPVSEPASGQEPVTKRGPGRPRLPRDEDGNIIRD